MSNNDVGRLRTVLIGSVGEGWQSQDMDDNSWGRAYCKKMASPSGDYEFMHSLPIYDFYKRVQGARSELRAVKDYLKRDGINVLEIDEPQLAKVTPQPGIYPDSECLPFNAANVRDPFIMLGKTLVVSRSTRAGTTHIPDWYMPLLRDFCGKQGLRVLESPVVPPHLQLAKPGLWEDPDEMHRYIHTDGNGYNGRIYEAFQQEDPIFEPADMFRTDGRRVFCMESMVSNGAYHEWFRREFPEVEFVPFRRYFYSEVDVPMHSDASYVTLDSNTIMMAPEQMPDPETIRKVQERYRILIPPRSDLPNPTSRRYHLNTLSLDEKRMLVNAQEKTMIKWLESYGYKPIPMEICNMNFCGGGFHCTSLDLERDDIAAPPA
uniref:Glycine amidinotransferase, mitochondrial n=4 Tax=Alexandrium minutum TaxID=39455 RepID=L7WS96_ALEMI|nr:amidinotransferase [Alexandrium minutum]